MTREFRRRLYIALGAATTVTVVTALLNWLEGHASPSNLDVFLACAVGFLSGASRSPEDGR